MIEDILIKGTGEGCKFWCDYIGNLIPKYSKPTDNPLHGFTESNLWVRDLADEIWKRVQERYDLTRLDENIITSKLLTLILGLWSCRIIRAKAYDPRRPVEIRQGMMKKLLEYHHALLDCISDESNDHVFFPSQGWDAPFAPNAKDGTFI